MVIALDREVKVTKEMLTSPDRMYLDLHNSRLKSKTLARTYEVNDLFIKQIRVGVNRPGTVRVVLDFAKVNKHSLFSLYDPFRLIIDTTGDTPVQSSTPPPSRKLKTAEAEIRLEPGFNKKGSRQRKARSSVAAEKRRSEPHADSWASRSDAWSSIPVTAERIPARLGPRAFWRRTSCSRSLSGSRRCSRSDWAPMSFSLGAGDQFVPLEERTAIANQQNADLFISIHANSSRSRRVAGSETFFLSFASTSDEQEVASRENAASQRNIRELEDLLKQIALGDYHAESRQLADVVQANLHKGMRAQRPNQKNRGVKKAPFIVLIGANMPSILSEIAFISNTGDEKYLKEDRAKNNIAEALYTGVAAYFRTLGTLPLERTASTK